jgi:hypothetical protein
LDPEKLSKIPVIGGFRAIICGPKIGQRKFIDLDGLSLTAARLGKWKLRFKADSAGMKGIGVDLPALYNLDIDPDESYNAAMDHPDIVSDITRRVEALIPGFPEEVQAAWAMSRTSETTY